MAVKKRDTSKKRESILDAAVKAFADEGYENASMDRIAEIADASKRTVYNHFPSKDVLFEEVLDRFINNPGAHLVFQVLDRGIVLENIVSDFGPCHGMAHGVGGFGDGVGAEIDRLHGG